nr:MAG TPA: hypothetical protein [Caudoviricetes sp.]
MKNEKRNVHRPVRAADVPRKQGRWRRGCFLARTGLTVRPAVRSQRTVTTCRPT